MFSRRNKAAVKLDRLAADAAKARTILDRADHADPDVWRGLACCAVNLLAQVSDLMDLAERREMALRGVERRTRDERLRRLSGK